MTAPQEIECKFEVEGGAVEGLVERVSAVFGPAGPSQPMTSVYFDTRRLSLWKKGLTLRVRSAGERRVQTVKRRAEASGGLYRREEWETEIDGRQADLEAAAKTPVAKVLKRRRRLRPVFETTVLRTTWRAAQDGTVIDIVLDRGEVRTLDASRPICEVELELKGGSPAGLFAAVRRLRAEDWLQPAVEAKSERGFALLEGRAGTAVKAEPILLDADMSTGAAVQVILRGCLRQFRRNAPLLAGRTPEPLHQARVGLRRLRSALTLFKPALHDDVYDDLAARLRDVSRQFGAARDLDVYLQRSAAPEAVRPDGKPGAGAFLAAVRTRREAAYDRLLEMLGSPAFRRLMLDLFLWIEGGAWLTTADPERRAARERPIAAFAADLLKTRRRKVRTRGRGFMRLSPAARHRLRIAAKTLRYAAEFTASVAHRGADRARQEAFMDALEALQADLGELNDIATGHRLADDIADQAHATPAAFAAGHATGTAEARTDALLRSAAAGRRAVLNARPFWSRW